MHHLSSKAACDAIANRHIRHANRDSDLFKRAMNDVMYPAFDRLVLHGKFSRAAYRETWSALTTSLTGLGTMVSARFDDLRPSPASTNDRNRARCTFMQATSEKQLEFVSCHVVMTRHEISCRVWLNDVIVGGHVISRFMQREQREPTDFVKGISDTLHAARLILPATAQAPGRRAALAFGEGLLLGNAEPYDQATHGLRHAPREVRFTKNGPDRSNQRHIQPMRDGTPLMTVATFVDAPAMGPSNTRIHRMLTDWQTRHRDGIAAASEGLPPDTAPVMEAAAQADLDEKARKAAAAALSLVRTDAWSRFSTRAYQNT